MAHKYEIQYNKAPKTEVGKKGWAPK
jgi:hypothetical protein